MPFLKTNGGYSRTYDDRKKIHIAYTTYSNQYSLGGSKSPP